jgi:DNA-binding transcriptional regulator YbjK
VAGLTHRAVAAHAGVPVGATTYYFATLQELITAALRHATGIWTGELEQLAERLDAADDPAAELAEATCAYLARDDQQALTETELYLAAAHRPELRPLARLWSDGLTRALARRFPVDRARAAAVFTDGVLLDALTSDRPLDTTAVTVALSALLGPATA